MKYNINKLKSWKLRYLVCDDSGQYWAFQHVPTKEGSIWILPESDMPPKITHKSSEEEHATFRQHYVNLYLSDEHLSEPVYDVPSQVECNEHYFDLATIW